MPKNYYKFKNHNVIDFLPDDLAEKMNVELIARDIIHLYWDDSTMKFSMAAQQAYMRGE